MSKELTPLEAFRIIKYNESECDLFDFNKLNDIIETALKRLEEIDKAYQKLPIDFRKVIKTFDIIKEKKIDTTTLFICLKRYDLETFNSYVEPSIGEKVLTQEEFDLLKEVLL